MYRRIINEMNTLIINKLYTWIKNEIYTLIINEMYNYTNQKNVLHLKMQMQTKQRTPLSNCGTKIETSVSSAYSWNSKKRLSYHVI